MSLQLSSIAVILWVVASSATPAVEAEPTRINGIDLVWHWQGPDDSEGSHRADTPINPASIVKVATTLWALETLGPDRRFRTTFATRGEIDTEAGVLRGDLLVLGGGDPDFHVENAQLVARRLAQLGIRRIEGDLVVSEGFWIDWERGSEGTIDDPARRAAVMAERLARAWDPRRWNAGRLRAMQRYRRHVPDVKFVRIEVNGTRGLDSGDEAPTTLFEHVSNPLAVMLKRFNDYSNNDIERLAWHLGDAPAMTRFYRERWGDDGSSIRFETLSGLGSNRMSPRQITRLIRELSEYATRHEMASGDLLPVLDCGNNTLRNYPGLSAGLPPASLVAKTGTLVKTDGGVVALAGSVATETGTVEFLVAAPRNGARLSAARRAQTRWLLDRADGWRVVGAECGADPGYSYGDARIAPEPAVGG